MSFVADCSMVAAWLISDEHREDSAALFQRARSSSAIAPELLRYEIANVLLVQERRKRLDAYAVQLALDTFNALPIAFEPLDDQQGVVDLARQHNLTFYDASYLVTAVKQSVPIASFDKAILRAAPHFGVQTLIPLH